MSDFATKNSIIHGSGLLANSLRIISPVAGAFFAAGVSNSTTATESEYQREIKELKYFINQNIKNKIIYFSSFAAIDGNGRYAAHKRSVESLIKECAENFAIIRLPQVAGVTNNNTMLSFFVRKILTKQTLVIQKFARRRLIDAVDVARIADILSINIKPNAIVNIGPVLTLSAEKIANEVARVLGVEPILYFTDDGDSQFAEMQAAVELLGEHDPIFHKDYQRTVIEKYVPKLAMTLYDKRNSSKS